MQINYNSFVFRYLPICFLLLGGAEAFFFFFLYRGGGVNKKRMSLPEKCCILAYLNGAGVVIKLSCLGLAEVKIQNVDF